MVAKKNTLTKEIVQVNGAYAGEPAFIPPASMVDAAKKASSIWGGITDLPTLNGASIMTLLAEDPDGTLLFDTYMAKVLTQFMVGIIAGGEDFEPPSIKPGWYKASDPTGTRFGALDITFRKKGDVVSIARDDVVAVQMDADIIAYPGDLLMAAYDETADFGRVTTLLTQQFEEDVSLVDTDDVVLANAWCVEVESVSKAGANDNLWVDGTSYLVPNRDATASQIFALDETGAPDVDINYKTWDLGDIIPPEQMYKCVLGKCLQSPLSAGAIVAMEVW